MSRTVHCGDSFEWDEDKAARNLEKHGVSFEQAASIVDADPSTLFTDDFEHSGEEERFAYIGYSDDERLLVVNYTVRESKVRIISAREAGPSERKSYANAKRKRDA